MADFLRSNGISFERMYPVDGDPELVAADPEGREIRFIQPDPSPMNRRRAGTLRPKPVRLIHVGFIVRDRPATEHFYKDILGFRPYWHGGMKDGQDDWVSMQVPDGTDWLEFMVNVSPDADQRLRGMMNHIAIGVTDIQAAKAQLIKNGAKLTEEPKMGRDGKLQLDLYDPDGTRVELREFVPQQQADSAGPHPGLKP